MPEPDHYAAHRAGQLRDDWQFSRIFAGRAQPGFTALQALRAELQQVLAQMSEPGIAGIKFEWWRHEIESAFSSEAQHPLARALATHLATSDIAAEYCLELVDAAEMEAEGDPGFQEQDFRLYLYRSGGVLAEMLAQLSGLQDRRSLDAARRLGELKRFCDLVSAGGAMLRAGAWLFPAAWREGHDTANLSNEPNSPAARAFVITLLEHLDRERIATRTLMQDVALPPALALQWALAQRDYAKLREHPSSALLPQPPKGNPLARLWTAWRAARQSARRIS